MHHSLKGVIMVASRVWRQLTQWRARYSLWKVIEIKLGYVPTRTRSNEYHTMATVGEI
jgi:hypothetical protein